MVDSMAYIQQSEPRPWSLTGVKPSNRSLVMAGAPSVAGPDGRHDTISAITAPMIYRYALYI